ncbi:MAG: fibronectin type III domain-containing protein [Rhodanobacter sp.]|nr:MAG: fibronectin type III domain-containing protein [Rhodanobacter sp.]
MSRLPALLSITFLAATAASAASTQIHVSPNGNDHDVGTAAHPVRTLQHALALSRAHDDHAILLQGGTYRLTAPLHLTAADSGTSFSALNGEKVVLSGGVRIRGWHETNAGKHIWAAHVPDSITNSRQLYINGLRAHMTRGRVPVSLTKTATGYTASSDVMASWKNPSDIEFVYTGGNNIWSEHEVGLGAWTEPRCPVQSIVGNTITMAQPCWDNSTRRVMRSNIKRTFNLVGAKSVGKQPEYVANAFELLGTPGHFYFDRSAHTLYYVPRPGENLATADVEMPVLQSLVDGGGSASAPIRDITFSGLQFSYATWLGPSSRGGYSTIQAGYQVTGADGYARQGLCQMVPNGTCPYGAWTPEPANVTLAHAQHVIFRNDDFIHLGAAGLALGDGAQNNLVEGCIFTDISGNGLELGGVDKPLAPIAQFTSGNKVVNNLFRNVAVEYRDGIPIVIGYARHTLVSHNQIDHVPYSAISIGWGGWPDKVKQSPQLNHSANNVVSDNLIHNIMLILADGAGIYTNGLTGPDLANGQKTTGNVIYDQVGSGLAIYEDNGSSMITMDGNVMLDANFQDLGAPHHDYYNGQHGENFNPLAILNNYWQQGDEDSTGRNVTVRGNHLINSLREVPAPILANAGMQEPFKSELEKRFDELVPRHAPQSPSRVAVAPGNGFALVTFCPPVDTGNSPVRLYTVTGSTGQKMEVSSADLRRLGYLKFDHLANRQPVTFTVTATNATGTSEPSLPSYAVTPDARPLDRPQAPAKVFARPGAHGEVSVHFQAPLVDQKTTDNSITAYQVTIQPGGRVVTFTGRNVVTLPDTPHTTFDVITGLKPGTYTFSVAAVNEAGPGTPATTKPVKVK